MDFSKSMKTKRKYALRKLDRRFRTKAIFDYEWIFLPIIQNNHFTMVVIHSHDNVNDIRYYDSYHSVGTDEILAVPNYLLHTARRLNLDRYLHWNIKGNEASIFPSQTDAVSCGVYLLIICAGNMDASFPLMFQCRYLSRCSLRAVCSR